MTVYLTVYELSFFFVYTICLASRAAERQRQSRLPVPLIPAPRRNRRSWAWGTGRSHRCGAGPGLLPTLANFLRGYGDCGYFPPAHLEDSGRPSGPSKSKRCHCGAGLCTSAGCHFFWACGYAYFGCKSHSTFSAVFCSNAACCPADKYTCACWLLARGLQGPPVCCQVAVGWRLLGRLFSTAASAGAFGTCPDFEGAHIGLRATMLRSERPPPPPPR